MTVTHKTIDRVTVKDETKGEVSAVFATLGVVDKDGDVTLPGAFTAGAPVIISAYGHKSWDGDLPLGTGVIREVGDEVVMEGRFFMDTTHGRDAFLTVKELSEVGLQEWSYSLEGVVSEPGEFDGRSVSYLKKINVKEVSPVLRGAGVNTRTLVAKSAEADEVVATDATTKFSEHADVALAGVRTLVTLAVDRLTERQAAGKSTDEQRRTLDLLEVELDPLREALADPPTDHKAVETLDDVTREQLRFIAAGLR